MTTKTKPFSKLSKAQKRVRIAKDVLAQLASGKFVPTPGTYVDVSDVDISEDGGQAKVYAGDHQLQELYEDAKSCSVCAIGSIFVSAVQIADNLTSIEAESDFDGSHPEIGKMFDYIGKFFTTEQLDLIESAFEADWDLEPGIISHELCLMVRKLYKGKDPETRMKLIMQNIIHNDGEFVVPREFVRKCKKQARSGKLPADFEKYIHHANS